MMVKETSSLSIFLNPKMDNDQLVVSSLVLMKYPYMYMYPKYTYRILMDQGWKEENDAVNLLIHFPGINVELLEAPFDPLVYMKVCRVPPCLVF